MWFFTRRAERQAQRARRRTWMVPTKLRKAPAARAGRSRVSGRCKVARRPHSTSHKAA